MVINPFGKELRNFLLKGSLTPKLYFLSRVSVDALLAAYRVIYTCAFTTVAVRRNWITYYYNLSNIKFKFLKVRNFVPYTFQRKLTPSICAMKKNNSTEV